MPAMLCTIDVIAWGNPYPWLVISKREVQIGIGVALAMVMWSIGIFPQNNQPLLHCFQHAHVMRTKRQAFCVIPENTRTRTWSQCLFPIPTEDNICPFGMHLSQKHLSGGHMFYPCDARRWLPMKHSPAPQPAHNIFSCGVASNEDLRRRWRSYTHSYLYAWIVRFYCRIWRRHFSRGKIGENGDGGACAW